MSFLSLLLLNHFFNADVYFEVVYPRSYLFMHPNILMNLKRVMDLDGRMMLSLGMIGAP